MEVVCFILIIMFPFMSFVYADEGGALVVFKNGLEDPNGILNSWGSGDLCTWFHVTCNSDNNVTRVDLGNSELAGQLVPDLGNLTKLQYLEVYGNKITGSIPVELGNLTDLVSLDLYDNTLTGSIPQQLGNLKNLQWLRLYNNKLSGAVPEELTTLPNIKTLDISGNPGLCGPIVNVACPP